jgi:L-iditol 2-dehydrogenase
MLTPGGQLNLIGIPELDRISFEVATMRRKELTVQNVRRQNRCMEAATALVASGQVNIDPMMTHHFSLDQCKDALDLVEGYRDGVIKAMVHITD